MKKNLLQSTEGKKFPLKGNCNRKIPYIAIDNSLR